MYHNKGNEGENFIMMTKMMWYTCVWRSSSSTTITTRSIETWHTLGNVCGMYFAVARIIITGFIGNASMNTHIDICVVGFRSRIVWLSPEHTLPFYIQAVSHPDNNSHNNNGNKYRVLCSHGLRCSVGCCDFYQFQVILVNFFCYRALCLTAFSTLFFMLYVGFKLLFTAFFLVRRVDKMPFVKMCQK